jgi:nucleoporin NUP82
MLKQTSPLSSGTPILDLLQANHPVLLMDPIHDDTVYVYHAFGVHVLDFGDLLQCLTSGLRADDDDGVALNQALQKSAGTHVVPLLNTYSVDEGMWMNKPLWS